jgi:hypothetical protein
MTHQVLQSVLTAQEANATIAGRELRTAAENLVNLATDRMRLRAFDAAGERIIGAALLLSDALRTWDYTAAFPSEHTCLLVGGVVAGPAGIVAAADAARAAGAPRVFVAILSGWTQKIPGVSRIQEIGVAHMRVA